MEKIGKWLKTNAIYYSWLLLVGIFLLTFKNGPVFYEIAWGFIGAFVALNFKLIKDLVLNLID